MVTADHSADKGSSEFSGRPARALALKWHLVLLVAGALLPLVGFAAVVVYRLAESERAANDRRLLRSAQDLSHALDRELQSTIRTLSVLAESEEVERADLRPFYDESKRVLATQPAWRALILLTPNGRQVSNTDAEWGAKLPEVLEPESLRRAVEQKRPAVGTLSEGKLRPGYGFSVRVPVLRGGEVRYVLTAVSTPDALASVVGLRGGPNEEWARVVVDPQGTIVARSHEQERFVGTRVTDPFLQRMRESGEGLFPNVARDGSNVYVAYSREPSSGWTTAVAVPAEVVESPARSKTVAVLGIGLALLALSTLGAFVISRHVRQGLLAAAEAAETMSRGRRPEALTSNVKEVAQLGRALTHSAALLAQHERERDAQLARATAARAEAEKANRLKDEFLATVSHELRTPLTAILGWAHILETGGVDQQTARHAVAVIRRNALQQRQIVEDILDVSRVITGKLRLESGRVELTPVVQAALDTIAPAAEAKGLRLRSSLDPEAAVTGDASRLRQVVWNLLANAVKFTPAGGEVRASVERLLTHVRIEVSDTGQGIAPEFLPYAFDRFRQADMGTTRQHGGLGLGLAIVRHLVEAHGGSVHAYSAGEGLGATFTLDLPLTVEAEPPAPRAEAPAAPAQGAGTPGDPQAPPAPLEVAEESLPPLVGMRVLAVDDDEDTLEMLSLFLRRAGAEVASAPSAAAALEVLERFRPDVLVADIGMPDVDGYELLRRVRALGAGRGGLTPAVALTAYAGEADRARALRSGFQAHLPKPVEPDALIDTVTNLAGTAAPAEP